MSKDDPKAVPVPQAPADAAVPVEQGLAEAAAPDTEPLAEAKDPAAVALGSRGGRARAKKLDARQRSDSARKAAQSRWRKPKSEPEG